MVLFAFSYMDEQPGERLRRQFALYIPASREALDDWNFVDDGDYTAAQQRDVSGVTSTRTPT
ncbi:MAG: hypothetical protein ACLS37_08290 [Alistipes sp.]